ncbi:extracellular solute-binding protein [Dinoroseobacter sp. PD6]|uniref:extracellular solute-binding protein n=1 Tax=Dinoroseobacter sp. PD6 TaxID=3028384 RepID=UPI00237B0D92|nr:extracellular solute-binding protein [Dinoroseobacter sp. PD6]MDD9718343.1 extracellular solute-binding protein [Dinoroseobacter sp. PD6]
MRKPQVRAADRPWITRRYGPTLSGLALGMALALAALPVRADMITSHGISTFGELKYPADFPHLDYVNPDAPKGGEMSVWAFGSFDSMNPYTLKGRAAGLSNVFFESLLTGTADEIGAAYCLLCESLTYPEDRSEVTFTLREGITFSDGTPLTAQDVVFSYEILLTKGLPSFRAQLAQKVESAEALDDRTVRFVFKEGIPTRDLISDVGALPVFSEDFYTANDRDFEETSLEPLVGSGPYVLGRMDVGQTVVYERNPDYWGAELPINLGRNNFDAIRIEYYADYNAAFEGFKGGTYTFRNEASSKIWATGYDFPAIQEGSVIKAELPNGSKATGQAWVFNLRRPQFQDPRVREALGMMFNFEWSNETLFYGIYDYVDSFWDNSELEATGLPTEAEIAILQPLVDEGLLAPEILTSEPFSFPRSGTRQLDRGNLRAASALLDEAGWEVGDDGLRRKNGQTLSVEFLNDSQTFDRVINPYVENLKRLGVDARHTRIDNAQMTLRERPPSYDFDLVTTIMATQYIPGSSLRQYFGSETADTSTFNKMGLQSEAVDRLIEVVLGAESNEELTTSVHALDRVLRAEKFWVPQWNKNTHTVAYYDMYEHPETLPPYALGNLDFWWFNAEKAEALRAKGAL